MQGYLVLIYKCVKKTVSLPHRTVPLTEKNLKYLIAYLIGICYYLFKSKQRFIIMQVLKEEVRQNILSSAKKLFYEKGYANATIRDIAKLSGITVGNVYRYFKSKENVLEGIVEHVHEKILDILSFSEKLVEEGANKSFTDFRNIINEFIINISKEYRLELLILCTRTRGTKYETIRDDLVSLIENRIHQGLFRKSVLEYKEAGFLSKIAAHAFLDSLLMIISGIDENGELEKMIYILNDFYFNHVELRFEARK